MIPLLVVGGVTLLRAGNVFFGRRGDTNRFITGMIVLVSAIAHAMLFAWSPSWLTAALAVVNIYFIINDLRFIELRMNSEYLKAASQRTWGVLTLIGAGFIALWWFLSMEHVAGNTLLVWYDFLAFCVAVSLATVAAVNIRRTRLHTPTQSYTDKELPTVTVAIPARNETETLRHCLTSLILSDYPKLEVLVLDDCSQDETAQIIKSFSHDGVRFIEGTPPPDERWLHKNWAYQQLLDAATGKIILFIGVDVEVHPDSLRHLVTLMTARDKTMLSLMPRRIQVTLSSLFVQPMRYWWELILPHIRRPAVLSTAWVITREALEEFGGFKSVSRAVEPERHIARYFRSKYGFYRTTPWLGVQTNKPLRDQIETAIRTRYPQLEKRPENVLLLSIMILFAWVGPLVRLLAPGGRSLLLPFATLAILVVVHVGITLLTNRRVWPLSLINFPIVVLLELVFIHVSMYEYEFSEVQWKGRNICMPVMYMTAHLPRLPDEPTMSS